MAHADSSHLPSVIEHHCFTYLDGPVRRLWQVLFALGKILRGEGHQYSRT